MQTENLIAVSEFCIHHNVEIAFIHSLEDSGLIQTIVAQENVFLRPDDLPQLERMTRLYYEMDINLEGIEAITYMLDRMERMNMELAALKGKLGFYESGE